MASRERKTTSMTSLSGRHHTTHAMMMTSARCPDDENRTLSRRPHPYTPTPRASPPPRHRSLASLTAVVVVVVGVVLGLVGPVHGGLMDFSAPEVIQYGTCAQPKDQEPFDFRQFNGLWYQVEMVPNSYMEAKKCITLHFDWNGEVYNVTTKGLNEYHEEVRQDAIITKELPQDPATSRPYLKIRASGVPPVPYHVVKTDYRRFACVYSCFELFSLMFEAFSVLSRSPELDDVTHDACHRAFAALNLDLTRLHPVHQGELCLGQELDGSGEGPPLQDQEDEENENALAALTGEEVSPSGGLNAVPDPARDPALEEDEGDALMEEPQVEEVEVEDEEARGDETGMVLTQEGETEGETGSRRGNETPTIPETQLGFSRNNTEDETERNANRNTEIRPNEGKDSHRRKPKKTHRRKRPKGNRRMGKKEDLTPSTTSGDQQLYLDDLLLDSLYYPEEKETRGGERGGKQGRGGGEGDEESLPAHDHLYPHDGAGCVAASAPLLLLALLTLALHARVTPRS